MGGSGGKLRRSGEQSRYAGADVSDEISDWHSDFS